VEVQVAAVLPTTNGSAVFLGNGEKHIVIYVDPSIGMAITFFMQEVEKPRPLTHDLIVLMLQALGARVERVLINDTHENTFYARLILSAENELTEQRKIIELDARPSDSIALAIQQKAPVFVAREVWEQCDDMTEVLEQMASDSISQDDDLEDQDEDEPEN